MAKIKQIWDNKTVIIVEHKVEHIWQHIDRVILFNYDGEIIADETPEIILKHYESLLSEYGVWHPHAWDYAPKPLNKHSLHFTTQSVVNFQDITIQRGKRRLLQIPELSIKSGEWITITGRNGTGKTTLLESMMQLLKYSGDLFIDNKKSQKLSKLRNTCI